MRRTARVLLTALFPALLWALLWPGSAQAYVKFSVESHGANLDPAYVREVTTLISDIHKSFVEALRLRVTSDVHVTLKFYKDQAEYATDARGVWGAEFSAVPPAFYRHRPMEVWAVDRPERRETTQAIVHESTHMFIHNLSRECPIWVHEGLAESFQACQLHQGRFVLVPWSLRDQKAKELLAAGNLPELGPYLDLERKAWQLKDDAGEPMRVASWSLGWFLLSTDDGRQLLSYLLRTYQDRRSEKCSTLVDRYWRGGLKALDAAWRAWIPGARTPMFMDIPNPEETSLTTLIK